MSERGEIRNRKQAAQIRDFRGLRFGNITPTDVDGMIEYQNKAFVFIETKFQDAELPTGQKLALERVCDALERSGRPTLVIVASHNSSEDIDMANTKVREFRWRYKWNIQHDPRTTRSLIEGFIRWINGEI